MTFQKVQIGSKCFEVEVKPIPPSFNHSKVVRDALEMLAQKIELNERVLEAVHVAEQRIKEMESLQVEKLASIQSKVTGVQVVAGLYQLLNDVAPSEDATDNFERAFRGALGTESAYSDRLAQQLDGKREVPVPTGFIDVLTETQVIEVKFAQSWKHAVGQVQMYGLYYPLHEKRVHLYGRIEDESLNQIKKWCQQVGVVVTHED